MKYFQPDNYLLFPTHKLTFGLVGCGGTGSFLLPKLAKLNHVLQELGHIGFDLTVYDDDIVERKNVLKQNFFFGEVGHKKGEVLVSKINSVYGFDWNFSPTKLVSKNSNSTLGKNVIISCTDNVKSREVINKYRENHKGFVSYREAENNYLWFDCGNTRDTGQVIMCDFDTKKKETSLKSIFDIFGDLNRFDSEEIQGPACSAEESLLEQDLTINNEIAHICWRMLWILFRDKRINYQGVFTNLKTMDRSILKIN